MTPSRLMKIGLKYKSKTYHRKQGNVIAILELASSVYVGVNSNKTSPGLLYQYKDGTVSSHHAEMAAVGGTGFALSLRKARLRVIRFMSDGSLGLARPCINCQHRLKELGIRANRIWFSNDSGQMERMNEYDS